MQIRYENNKLHKKTILDFKNESECKEYLEKILPTLKNYDYYLNELLINSKGILDKIGLKDMIYLLKKCLCTNVVVRQNSPIKIILNGHYRFEKTSED